MLSRLISPEAWKGKGGSQSALVLESYSRGAMCVGGVCVNLWTVIAVERFASVFNFVFIAVRHECGIIYCPDHLYTIYTLQHFTSIRKLSFPPHSCGIFYSNLKVRSQKA